MSTVSKGEEARKEDKISIYSAMFARKRKTITQFYSPRQNRSPDAAVISTGLFKTSLIFMGSCWGKCYGFFQLKLLSCNFPSCIFATNISQISLW